jgi:hypothetical protein
MNKPMIKFPAFEIKAKHGSAAVKRAGAGTVKVGREIDDRRSSAFPFRRTGVQIFVDRLVNLLYKPILSAPGWEFKTAWDELAPPKNV